MADCKDNDELFATHVHSKENEFSPKIRVFWTQIESSDNNSNSDSWVIHEKIKSAFCKLDSSSLNGLIQFWAPLETTGLLSASDQPFSLENVDLCFHKYRLCCTRDMCSIDEVEDDSPMVTAFKNHLPVVVDLRGRVHQGKSPLVRSALKYRLKTCLFLPVFYPSHSCVGVVECSMITGFDILEIFNKLKTALESVGLTTFHAQECRLRLYKSICGLKRATDEMAEALDIVCKSHDLTLGQVWISDTQTKPKFAVKLIGYCANSDDNLKDYYTACEMLPLIIGEGLSGKALQTYESRFCRNINELTDKGLLSLLPTTTEYSCLVICLRSLVTEDVDYVFDFLWPQKRNYLILLESMLLELRSLLPSFKLASGAELGEELRVIDAENSTGSGIGFLKILDVNRLSQLPKALEERRRLVADDCMSSSEVKCKTKPIPLPQEEAENQIGRLMNEVRGSARTSKRTRDVSGNSELHEPDFVKRKLSDVCDTEIESSQQDNNPNQEDSGSSNILKLKSSDCIRFLENTKHSASNSSVRYPVDDLIIRAKYGDQQILSYLPISSTYADILKNIDEAYNLGAGSYTLDFPDDENEWIVLDDETDWVNCQINRMITGIKTIQVRVQQLRRRYLKITYDRNN